MKLLIILFYMIIGYFNLYASELEIEVIGKTTRQNSIELPDGKNMCLLNMKEVLKVL